MRLKQETVTGLISSGLHGEWPALPVFLFLLHLADDQGCVHGSKKRIAAILGLPQGQLDAALLRLSQPDDIAKWPEEANGYIAVENRGEWVSIKINASHRYSESPRPSRHLWTEVRAIIFERDNYICVYCGAFGVGEPHDGTADLECDHIVPVSKGGSHDEQNLVTACKACNRSKRDKWLAEWKPELVAVLKQKGFVTGDYGESTQH